MIPKSVTVDQMVEASKPLCDLLGVTAHELYQLHWSLGGVTLVGVLHAEGDTSPRPNGIEIAGIEDGDARECGELSYHVIVDVV